MSDINNLESLFTSNGVNIRLDIQEFSLKVDKLTALILDWDGVFNDGVKSSDQGSPFSEVDSMGLNMFRFSFYLKHGYIPAIFIVTGENNQASIGLSQREHFNGVYIKVSDKVKALEHLESNFNINRQETGFVFDDILDLGLASSTGLRFFLTRNSNPLLNNYIATNQLADYTTLTRGSNHAVREVCEFCIGLLANYSEVVENRVKFSSVYRAYLLQRNNISTGFFTLKKDRIEEYSLP